MFCEPLCSRSYRAALKKKHLRGVLVTLLSAPLASPAFADDEPLPQIITVKLETVEAEEPKGADKKNQPMKIEKAVPNKLAPPKQFPGAPPTPFPPGPPAYAPPTSQPMLPPSGGPGASRFNPSQPNAMVPGTGYGSGWIPGPGNPAGNHDLLAPGGPIWKQMLELERDKLKAQAQAELTEMKFNLFAEHAEQNVNRLKEMLHEKEKHFAEMHEKAANQPAIHEKLEKVIAQSEAEKRELKTVVEKLEHQLRETREHAERLQRELDELRHHPIPHAEMGHAREGNAHPNHADGAPRPHGELPQEVRHLIEQSQRWEREIGELREMFGRFINQWREQRGPQGNQGRQEPPQWPDTNPRRPAADSRPDGFRPEAERVERDKPERERPERDRPSPDRRPDSEPRDGDQPRPEAERREG